jgi:hypothetical protein
MAKTMKKKRFDDGGSIRTRSADEIGDTDPRTGVVTPGSYDRRMAQGDKNLQSLKSLFGMGSAKPSVDANLGSTPTAPAYFDRPRAAPAPAPASPAIDPAMSQSIREAIMKRPTGMSTGSDRAPSSQVISKPTSPANPPSKRPVTKVESKAGQKNKPAASQSKGGSGGGRGPTAQELSAYASQKDAQRKAEYEKAQKEAETPAAKAKRSEIEKSQAITPDTDMMGLPVAGAGAVSAAMKLAKKLANMKKGPKSTAPFLKEIGNEPLKLGMKGGGSVKKMASGGMVGSASKRADGIAQRGKTKCKTY